MNDLQLFTTQIEVYKRWQQHCHERGDINDNIFILTKTYDCSENKTLHVLFKTLS